MESIYNRSLLESSSDRVGARGWVAYVTGLNLAFTVCYLTIKPPEPHSSTLVRRIWVSVASVAVACLIGWLGTRLTLPYRSKRHFNDLAQAGFRGWVFLPSIALFLQHDSLWAQIVAGASAMLMANYVSRFVEGLSKSYDGISRIQPFSERSMFLTEALIEPRSPIPFYVSACLFGAFAAAAAQWAFIEIFLMSLSLFLVVVQINSMQAQPLWNRSELQSHSYALVAIGLCLTFAALAPFANSFGAAFTGWSRSRLLIGTGKQKAPSVIFHTIVLWPKRSEEKIHPTFAVKPVSMSPGRAKAWSIPFTGPYWYTKVAGEVPDPEARVTQGDPLKVSVRSADHKPLIMEAHQHLTEPIDLSCCRELQVVIRNDASLGTKAVGLTLGDSHTRLIEQLGMRSVVAANDGLSPTELSLSFSVPQHGTIRSFDDITVALQSDEKHWTLGRKVAVERFVFIPR